MWGIGSWPRIYTPLRAKTLYALFREDENILLKCNLTRNYFACSLNEVNRRVA